MRKSFVWGNVLAVCLLAAASAWGQAGTNSGAIAGEVDDSSGAKVSGAKVEVASPALIERVRETATSDDGLFRITNLPPGIYTVTAEQDGFNTVKRENIEITTGFTATVNFSLTPGSVQQTVTVTTEAPVLDTQDSVVQKVLSNAVIESLPMGKSAANYPALVPGAIAPAANQDVGGLMGEQTQGFRIHGSANGDYQAMRDGMSYQTGFSSAGGNQMDSNNPTATQEIQLETSGYSAEDWHTGGHVNIIPKNGGNDLHGSVQGDFGAKSLQATNVTPKIAALGVPTPASIRSLYEVAGGVGGPIKKDKLWFFADGRHWITSSYQAGALYFYDANEFATFPNNLFYAADHSRQAYKVSTYADVGLRLTWQASMRNKFTENFIEQKNCECFIGLSGGALAPEAASNHAYKPNWREQATWTFPMNNKLLLWAGFTGVAGTIAGEPSGQGPMSIPVTDQTAGYSYGALGLNQGVTGTASNDDFLAFNENFTASYVSGPHAIKVGYTEMQARGALPRSFPNLTGANGYPNGVTLQLSCQAITDVAGAAYNPALLDAAGLPTTSYKIAGTTYAAPAIALGTVNSLPCTSGQALLPSQLSEFLSPYNQTTRFETHSFFGQDQWRVKRLTINAGLRLDWMVTAYLSQTEPANPQYGLPAKSFPGMTGGADWKDLNPRLGAAYDLFGNGKTAIKASLSRGVLAEGTLSGIATLTNPVNKLVSSTTRTFKDLNGNFIPDGDFTMSAANGELGPAVSPGFYTQSNAANVTYADNVTQGWMNRPDDWQFSASVQQEILRGFALSFGFYRTWFGNRAVARNAVPAVASNYDQYCVTPPVANAAYPGVGGTALCNLYDPIPAQLANYNIYTVEKASIFGNLSDVYTGVDVIANARFHGLTLQGGLTAGHEVTNYCVQVNSPEDLSYTSNPSPTSSSIIEFTNNNFSGVSDAAPCYINPPWYQNLQFKMAAVYTIPWQKIKISANEQNLPSIPLAASYSYKTANITFVGTPAAGHTTLVGCSTCKVEALTPQTVFAFGRNNQLDFRIAKDFTIRERWKIEPTVDFYNLLNASTILGVGTTYNTSAPGTNGAWRNVSTLLPARLVKFGVHVDF